VSEPVVTITVTRRVGREPVDSEVKVMSLEELYDTCRKAGPSELIRVTLTGPEGEVRLGFKTFMRRE